MDIRFVICDPNKSAREITAKMLSSIDSVWLQAECSGYSSIEEVLSASQTDLLVIGIDSDIPSAIEMIQWTSAHSPNTSIIALSSHNDGKTILDVMRAGAKEFLNAPVEMTDLVKAIQRVTNLSTDPTGETSRSKSSLIAVAGVNGGVGTTSIAVNLAASLAADPTHSVALADLDLSVGDVDIFLDCIPEYTLLDVANNVGRLDLSLLKKSMTKHESDVYLLPRPVSLQDNALIDPEKIQRVLGLLKAAFTHLVVDTSKYYSAIDFAALKAADHIILVTQLDLPCLRNIVRLLLSLEEYPGMKEKVKVVVNRSGLDSSNQISIKKAEETIGQNVYWQIPNDYGTMAEVRNTGVPLIQQAPRAGITQAIDSLTYNLIGKESSTRPTQGEDPTKSNWLNKLLKR